jgi:ketosteroid isomerase-like protein
MEPKTVAAAEAFSGHDFESAFDLLADDVEWDNVGAERLSGKDAVVEACRGAGEYFAGITTTFLRTRTVEGVDHVVVDTLAEYVEPGGGSSTVGSCDVYTVSGGRIAAITSYNVEVG